ncbi:MAG: single-stranded DNA-binding protein [Candidatus Thermoplasmatota archaeon]|jgi:replication factor A1|nr:single-stranded DNA-binding protein [Candidatus Thermoplasmatota archaeon]MCL5665733.1 single-stranded DNA-binding protein [Candidatus Thermoplasmatota archaeon]
MEGTTKIKDLTPSSRRVNVLGKVVSIGEPKNIQTRMGEEKQVTEVVVGDETGKITLSLWGDQVDHAKQGETLYIDNGYITLVKGHMRLNVGKYGAISKGEEEVAEVNEQVDMSEKEYENRYRRYGGGGGSYRRYGGSSRGYGGRGNQDNQGDSDSD